MSPAYSQPRLCQKIKTKPRPRLSAGKTPRKPGMRTGSEVVRAAAAAGGNADLGPAPCPQRAPCRPTFVLQGSERTDGTGTAPLRPPAAPLSVPDGTQA